MANRLLAGMFLVFVAVFCSAVVVALAKRKKEDV
jgi:hypothetical protein